MTLYEFLSRSENDYDAYDVEHDVSVTVCFIEKEESDYDKFCNGIIKKVEVIEEIDRCILYVNWSSLIKRNLSEFKSFSKKHWKWQYQNENTFIFEWIREIHLYFSGYVSEEFYSTLNMFVTRLK